MSYHGFMPRKALTPRMKWILAVLSFVLPIGLWSLVSYVPWIWHPQVLILNAGGSSLQVGERIDRKYFELLSSSLKAEQKPPVQGIPANPVFLPAPDQVVRAFYEAFVTPPRRVGDPWLAQSLWHSIQVIFWGFLLSSLIGIPLGLLCGTYGFFEGLFEPFIEFFRYLPAPAFGALAVAVLGIDDGPKIAIIFIGTFFQQVLVIANTTARIDPTLLEAAQTMGGSGLKLLFRVVIPGVLPDIYRDQRILLGWAWTYLIVAEVVGTSSGITFFIDQQAKYRIYANVFAAISMIGIIGISIDVLLAKMGKLFFPWKQLNGKEL